MTYSLIAGYRERSRSWAARFLEMDCRTTELRARSREAIARSRKLLDETNASFDRGRRARNIV